MNWIRLKLPPSTDGQGLDGQRLGQAGHALEQDVAAGQQADEQALEHRVLADDHPLDLRERLLDLDAWILGEPEVDVRHGVGLLR